MRFAAALVCALLAPAWMACAAAAAPAPQAVTASYDVYMNGVHVASMHETFEARDGEYRLVSESRAVGLMALFQRQPVRFVSSGRVVEQGLQPQRFEGQRSAGDARRVRGEFNWPAAQLTIEHDGRTETLPLPQGTQDRLSVMYQFMFLPQRQPQRMEISMTNGRKLDQYVYAIQPAAEIDTPIGRVTALHLVRQRQPDENATEIWLSPQHRHLPVRMIIVEGNGSRYEQVVTRLEIKP